MHRVKKSNHNMVAIPDATTLTTLYLVCTLGQLLPGTHASTFRATSSEDREEEDCQIPVRARKTS